MTISRSPSARATTVVLRHVLSDGSWHYDWLIDPPSRGNDASCLARIPTFRLAYDPLRQAEHADQGDLFVFWGERLPDHRRLYLTYQGPISDNRGTVTRISSGLVQMLRLGEQDFSTEINIKGALIRFDAAPAPDQDKDRWRFETRRL